MVGTSVLSQTFVVDAANGPGTNFTSLPAAVAAVPDGAVLLVRPGSYAGFTAAQKGLVVLGEPGVTITDQLAFDDLGTSQSIVLRDLHFQGAVPGVYALISLTTCRGPVLLDHITNTPGCSNATSCNPAVYAWRCAQLVVRDCTLRGPVQVGTNHGFRSATTFENCSLTGHSIPQVASPTPALSIYDGTVQIVSSALTGGGGGPNPLFGPANESGIVANYTADLRVLDSTIASGTAATFGGWAVAATVGQAVFRIDPASVLTGLAGPTSGLTPQVGAMPHLLATGAPPGGTLTATTATEDGDLVALAVGLPGPTTTTVPGISDPFWFGMNTYFAHTIGVQQSGTPVSGAIAVPSATAFEGVELVWHAVCYGAATGLQNSNPAISLIH
ncbi:MAG: hypothetical protein KDE27_14225 [Planctomycetes bacterium]|nr:hypothetical protein [Planctomycetota bacterium]